MAFLNSKVLFMRHKYPISKSANACLLSLQTLTPAELCTKERQILRHTRAIV